MKRDRVEDIYPLSPIQQGILWETLQAPESGVYVVQLGCRIAGPLAPEVLREAWRRVLARHPVLRTAFAWKRADRPLQVVHRQVELPWEELDWRHLPPRERQARLERLLEDDRARGFDPGAAPLLRLVLVREEEAVHRFLWTVHHLLLDGWSMSLLMQEVLACFTALSAGREPSLPPVRPFGDYVGWLERQDLAAAEAFWRRELDGLAEPTRLEGGDDDLPSRPGELRHAGFRLGRGEAAVLERLARGAEVTLNTVFQAAWAVVLGRHTGRRDVTFGAVVAGRPPELAGSQAMIGVFLNTLPVRVRLPSATPVAAWLADLQARHSAQRRFEHTPLVKIQGWSGLPAGQAPFDSLLVFENYPSAQGEAGAGGLEVRVDDTRTMERTSYPLTLTVLPGAEIEVQIAYDGRRFETTRVRRLLAELRRCLLAFAEHPETPLGRLPLLAPAAAQQTLVEWNDTAGDRAHRATLHELFAAQAARTPDAVALSTGTHGLTYAAVERRARHLARRLRARGVGPEERVALLVERSPEMVIGMLAVLFAGGAYVPLDPDYPAERLETMLADCGARVLLTRAALAERLAGGGRGQQHPPTELLDALAAEPAAGDAGDDPGPQAGPDSLAYAIYTSGSTGRPKGVAMSHAGILNRLLWALRSFPWTPADRLLHKTPHSFDASIWEIFVPLFAGACVEIAEPGGHRDPGYLAQAVAERRVTMLQLVPSLLGPFLDVPGLPRLAASLRILFAGGEALPGDLVERLRRRLPGVRLQNLYGPTEAAIDVTSRACPSGAGWGTLPIGRPLPNVHVRVLDAAGRPLPPGAPGELFLGGPNLARGYLDRPALTAERFVPDPFAGRGTTAPGERLYRTGDGARWLPWGEVEFLGRLDSQVKLRGFRIEPGEVEAALRACAGVREAVVVVREDRPGSPRLVAYVAHGEAPPPDAAALRDALAATLPEHMVPAVFVALPELPRAPNGKLDRRALPAPEPAAGAAAGGGAAPRTPAEARLAAIWADVLGVPRVGVHDNFFAVGGDSILALQVVARANREGLALTPRQLFRHQTVAELAAVAGTGAEIRAEQGEVRGEAPLAPIQHWFFAQRFRAPHHWNLALLFAAPQRLAAAPLAAAVRRLLFHHDALRLRFPGGAEATRQRFASADEPSAVHVVDLAGVAAGAAPRAVERAAEAVQASLDLERGPLLRSVAFDLGEGGSRLLLVAHHLVVDGVSWRILLEDLQTLYEAASAGRELELPPKTSSFQAWTEALAAAVAAGRFDAELPHWRRLADHADAAEIPVDRPGAPNLAGPERRHTASLGREETAALLHEAPTAYRTEINDLLLAALAAAFAEWTGRRHLLVELEGHGREDLFDDVDVTRTVGWFTSQYPVLLEAPEGNEPGELLCTVKEQLRAVPGRGIGYGLLRYLGGEERGADLAALPQPQVAFNYLGQLDRAREQAASLLTLARETSGPDRDRGGHRPHRLAINANVADGRLHVAWTYNRDLHDAATVERLAERYLDRLRRLVEHCRQPQVGGFTPSDFPLARLGAARLEALARHLRAVPHGPAGGGPREVEDVYPLSPLQEGLLVHAAGAAASRVGFEQMSAELGGDLDVPAFLDAWQQVIDRHPILRTSFPAGPEGARLQVVWRRCALPVERLDWSGGGAPAEERLAELLAADRERGFDLERSPLTRLTLVRRGERSHHLVWSCHHLVLDAWCREIVLGEVWELYRARREGRAPELPARRPFRDYVEWLERQDLSAAEAFWRRELAGAGAPSDPGLGLPAPGGGGVRALGRQLEEAATTALAELARRHGLTLNTVVHGAWALLLARYTGRREVVFGTTVSGRPADLPGSDQMAGMFINNLPVRVAVDPGEPLVAWLQQLQERLAEVRQYEYCSPLQVQEWAGAGAGRLFHSLLVFQNHPAGRGRGPAAAEAAAPQQDGPPEGAAPQAAAGAGEGALAVHTGEGRMETVYPLNLEAVADRRLGLVIHHDAGRFEAAAVHRMLAHLGNLLSAMVAAPAAPLGDLAMLAPEERRGAVLAGPSAQETGTGGAPADPLAGVAEAARRRPETVAVAAGERSLSWRALAERVAGRAAALRRAGVGAESRVPVAGPAGPDAAVELLAVLAAGGAFVRTAGGAAPEGGPGAPPAGSGASGALSAGGASPGAPLAGASSPGPGSAAMEPTEVVVPVELSPEAAACLLPGGAVLSRRALLAAAAALAHLLPEPEAGPVRLDPAAAPDPAGLDLLAPLLASRAVACVDPAAAPTGGDAGPAAAKIDPSAAESTASAEDAAPPAAAVASAALLAAIESGGVAAAPERPAPLLVAAGGLGRGLAERLRRRGWEPVALWLPEVLPVPAAAGPAPEGEPRLRRPLLGAVRVLSARLEPLPPEVAGFLCLAGPALPRSLGGPRRTAEHLLPDPFAAGPGERLLWTGERGRLLADGSLQPLGRGAAGELEAALRRHPEVAAVAVVPAPQRPGRPAQVLAHVVPADGAAPSAEALGTTARGAAAAAGLLGFVPLAEPARGPWGGLDRARLPAGDEALARLEQGAAAPRDPLELKLVRLWEELLQRAPIGIRDDFFELGGHSALAVQLLARVARELGHDLPPAMLFRAATVENLARALRERHQPAVPLPLVEIQGAGGRPPLFCVHPGGGGTLCYVDLAWALGPDQPVYGLQAPGWADDAAPLDRVEDMAAAYVEALRRVQPEGPYRLAGWSFGGFVAYEMSRRLEADGEEVALLAMLDVGFDPDTGTRGEVDDAEALAGFLTFFRRTFPLEVDDEALRAVGDVDAQIAWVVAEGERRGLLPPEVDLPRLRRMFDVFRGCLRAERRYVPSPYPGRATLFRATAGPAPEDPLYGLGRLTAGVEVFDVPARHEDLVYRPAVHVLAEQLSRCLDRAVVAPPAPAALAGAAP